MAIGPLGEFVRGADRAKEGTAVIMDTYLGSGLAAECLGAPVDEDGRGAVENVIGLSPVVSVSVVRGEIVQTFGDVGVKFAKRARTDLKRSFEERFRFRRPSGVVEDDSEVVEAVRDEGMALAQGAFADFKGSAGERLGF